MNYGDCTINVFMKAWFEFEKQTILTKDEFDSIYTQYIDTAGLFLTENFEKVSYIHYISNRINSVSLGIRLQRDFLNNFDKPNIPELKFFEKFGHKIYWGNDRELFINALNKIEAKEKKYISQLEKNIKELMEMNLKHEKKEVPSIKKSRDSFVRMLVSLGKIGYKIDRSTTTVEELACMIKLQSEESKIK